MQGIKYVFCLVSLLAGSLTVGAQNAPEPVVGEVSYKSSQTIYVRFASTRDIAIGDTLYFADSASMTAIYSAASALRLSVVSNPVPTLLYLVYRNTTDGSGY